MVSIEDLDITGLEKAVKTLKAALKKEKPTDLERDGTIQRFEYTFELSWKIMRKVLQAMGRGDISASPKPILRDASEEGLIDEIERWFSFLEARNLSTHIYNERESVTVYRSAKDFLPYAEKLLKKLKSLK